MFMLNPDVVKRLRIQINLNEVVDEFEGVRIGRTFLEPADASKFEVQLLEQTSVRQMLGPSNIFGVPVDVSCLNGTSAGPREIPEARLYTIKNGRIIGNNVVVGLNGELFSPSANPTSTSLSHFLKSNASDHQGFVASETVGKLSAFYAKDPNDRVIEMNALFLHNLEPGNYGSFIFRQLPQLLLLRRLDVNFDVYIVPDRTPWIREVLQLIGLPNLPILTVREVSGCEIKTINFLNEFDAEGFLSDNIARQVRGLSRTIWSAKSSSFGKNLYISRRLGSITRPNYRTLTNEAEIESYVESRGFQVIYPEAYSFGEQVAMFRSARAIVGPSGSGMLNAVFSEPGTKILDMESFHYTVRQHAKIYASTDKDYSFLFGQIVGLDRSRHHLQPWNVSMDILRSGIDWLLS